MGGAREIGPGAQPAFRWGMRSESAAKVLLAEDDRFTARLVVDMLHSVGLEVSVATDGGEALRLVEELKPGSVLRNDLNYR